MDSHRLKFAIGDRTYAPDLTQHVWASLASLLRNA
jgi:hypothetical protein